MCCLEPKRKDGTTDQLNLRHLKIRRLRHSSRVTVIDTIAFVSVTDTGSEANLPMRIPNFFHVTSHFFFQIQSTWATKSLAPRLDTNQYFSTENLALFRGAVGEGWHVLEGILSQTDTSDHPVEFAARKMIICEHALALNPFSALSHLDTLLTFGVKMTHLRPQSYSSSDPWNGSGVSCTPSAPRGGHLHQLHIPFCQWSSIFCFAAPDPSPYISETKPEDHLIYFMLGHVDFENECMEEEVSLEFWISPLLWHRHTRSTVHGQVSHVPDLSQHSASATINSSITPSKPLKSKRLFPPIILQNFVIFCPKKSTVLV